MRVPLYLEVAQWALLFGLGSLVIVLYRQLGRLLSQSGKQPGPGPAVGAPAAPLRYHRMPGGDPARFVPGGGQPALVAFVDPTCPSCEQLVSNLGTLRDEAELPGVRILLLISDPPGYLGISAAFQATSLEIGRPVSTGEVEFYRATGTPLLVAVDGTGTVRAAGVASGREQVLAFAEAMSSPGAMSGKP